MAVGGSEMVVVDSTVVVGGSVVVVVDGSLVVDDTVTTLDAIIHGTGESCAQTGRCDEEKGTIRLCFLLGD